VQNETINIELYDKQFLFKVQCVLYTNYSNISCVPDSGLTMYYLTRAVAQPRASIADFAVLSAAKTEIVCGKGKTAGT
jgi:hypothetical protein